MTSCVRAFLAPTPSAGDLGSLTFPGPERGARNSSPEVGIGAQARNGRTGAHGAAAPLDPGRGAPWEAGWEGPPRAPPAPPRGPRRFRSPTGRPGSLDAPPGLYVAGGSGTPSHTLFT
ncbi:hypothetical protein J1605_010043 [Eschrichtius robustus]|uniref:Uncharacterized protein n=1 Tax=Eschrichtius robustus TaxID=9764 RepID=A0AB34GSP2_ESCRO|nr:hypothetical protein J1605_010043 [Eschrichtius robustus]